MIIFFLHNVKLSVHPRKNLFPQSIQFRWVIGLSVVDQSLERTTSIITIVCIYRNSIDINVKMSLICRTKYYILILISALSIMYTHLITREVDDESVESTMLKTIEQNTSLSSSLPIPLPILSLSSSPSSSPSYATANAKKNQLPLMIIHIGPRKTASTSK